MIMFNTPVLHTLQTARPQIFRQLTSLACAGLFGATSTSRGAVELITGDQNNNVHQQDSILVDLSADGDLVLFSSGPPASGSTPGITQGGLYVRKLSTNTLTYAGPGTGEGSFSDDGRYVTWRGSDNFIFWRDTVADITRNITPGADGASRRPIMSADGRFVAYASVARNVVSNSAKLQPAGHPGVYLYDSTTQTTKVVTLSKAGNALSTGLGASGSVASSFAEFDFSADGKFIVFSSDATNDRPVGYPAGFVCVYRRNLATGAVDLLNKTAGGQVAFGNFSTPRTSANGNRVAFIGGFVGLGGPAMISSVSNTFGFDLYVKEVSTGATWWATKTTNNAANSGALDFNTAISGDGQTVAFGSSGTQFVTANTDPDAGIDASADIFRVDLLGGGAVKTTLATSSPDGSGNVTYRFGPFLPGNGDYTAFSTGQLEAMLGTGSGDAFFFQGVSVSAPVIPSTPEIGVQLGTTALTDGKSTTSFGTVKVGKKGAAKTYTIKNSGNAVLSGLGVTIIGPHRKDFLLAPPAKNSLAGGASIPFKITFKPGAKGPRTATIQIKSNDANESPFDIKVSGTGGKK